MLVKDAIKYLNKMDGDEKIVMAWWELDSFDMDKDSEEWSDFVYVAEGIDWSRTHETMWEMYQISKED